MADQYISALSTTWNSSGTTYNAIKYNVTDSASASDSALVNLQIGGTSMFRVQKDGEISTAHYYSAIQKWGKGSDIASASALTVPSDGNFFDVTGTTTVTSISAVQVGTRILLQFDGVLTLTHHATDLVLPGGANITTAAGDFAEFVEYASGDWALTNYTTAAATYLANVVEDTTPQLGGDLDLNGNGIAFPGATVTDVTGADTAVVSGTAGTSGNLAQWNGDGDAVDAGVAASDVVTQSSNPQLTTIELGHASDTTLARVSAGAMSIEGVTVLTVAGGTMTGGLNFADQTLTRPKILDYGETVNAIGSIGGGTQDIDLESGNVVSGTVDTSTTTFTFSNPPATGTCGSFTLILTNGGSQTVNWPASVTWAGGTAPTLTASGVDVLTFFTLDAGTTWYGFSAGLDMQ